MRLGHLIFAVFMIAIGLAVARDPAGRVAVVVFLTGVSELALGVTAVMALFQTVGSIGHARGLLEHLQALAATAVIVAAGSVIMVGVLYLGAFLVITAV